MPDTKQRKESPSAMHRFQKEYITVDKQSNPYNFQIPKKEDTGKFRELMNTKNYIRILTKLDKNQYIMQQYWVYCEGDIWCTGDAVVFNNNPDKKIFVDVMCSARKAFCLCYDENSHEFLTICPDCKRVVVCVKDTNFKCPHCKYKIHYEVVNDLPYCRLPCSLCPIEIGWEKTQLLSDMVKSNLTSRSKVELREMEKSFHQIEKDLLGEKEE